MDRALIEKDHLIDRYVQGELKGETLEAFEVFMLEHGEIAAEVEYAKSMLRAIRKEESTLVGPHSSQLKQSNTRRFFLGPTWAVAATILLTVSLAFNARWIADQDIAQVGPVAGSDPVGVSNAVWLEPQRSANLPLEVGASAYLLNIDVSLQAADRYQVNLLDEARALVWSVRGLRPNDDQIVQVFAPALEEANVIYVVSIAPEPTLGALVAEYAITNSAAD
ncbi:MAG: hypothetical protein AAFX44_04830 [Pseudomonadota bacterium]